MPAAADCDRLRWLSGPLIHRLCCKSLVGELDNPTRPRPERLRMCHASARGFRASLGAFRFRASLALDRFGMSLGAGSRTVFSPLTLLSFRFYLMSFSRRCGRAQKRTLLSKL
jgi:hypothetical protein